RGRAHRDPDAAHGRGREGNGGGRSHCAAGRDRERGRRRAPVVRRQGERPSADARTGLGDDPAPRRARLRRFVSRGGSMKSSLLYSYQIEHDDGLRTFMESVEQMVLAEQYDFDTVLVSEHHLVENGYFPAPMVTNGAIAMRTKKPRIGPGVLLLPL